MKRGLLSACSALSLSRGALAAALLTFGAALPAQDVLPSLARPPAQALGRTVADSDPPAWPSSPKLPKGTPNVLLILTDDVGFGASSTFGGPIPTPTFDALARRGLRYNAYNNTAICSATRAALLTGRNEHKIGQGAVTNAPTGYEGYTSAIPRSAGTVAQILKQSGFSTAAFGKWHLVPEWEESQVGPFDHWPTNMGFQYYYGFLSADTDQWSPALVEGTKPIEPPHDDPGYILDKDLANQAIRWLREHHQIAPDIPYFVYYATGSTHAPHAAPKEWIEKFRGRFDQGWDKMREESFARQKAAGIIPASAVLTPRPAFIPSWSSLTAEQKRVFARLMEVYAAQLSYADAQIGRVIDEIRAEGQLDNTLIIFIEGDNGASGEGARQGSLYEQAFINRYDEPLSSLVKHIDDIGGPRTFSNYPTGWGWAMNTPFQYYKQTASHFGGLRDGMVISWPAAVKDMGGLRTQFHYVTDIAPTILDAVNISAPVMLDGIPQMPMDGISMRYTFDHAAAPSRRRTQVFEMMQNLGIYHDGWWAGTTPTDAPWDFFKVRPAEDPDTRHWELYNISNDYSQGRDLAKSNPAKLRQMQEMFWAEAGRNNILPLHSISEGAAGRPSFANGRTSFTFYPGLTRLPASAAPNTLGKSFEISADVVLPAEPAHGVLVTHGGRFGGYALYMKDGRLVFHYNAIGDRQYRVAMTAPLGPGAHHVAATFVADAAVSGSGGTMTLSVDGAIVATGRIDHTLFARISLYEGMDVGEDTLTPINDDYTIATSKFSGELKQLRFDVK